MIARTPTLIDTRRRHAPWAAVAWTAILCLPAVGGPAAAAGLKDFTADARLAVTSVTINDGSKPKIFNGARLVAGRIVHYEGGGGVSLAVRGKTDVSALDRAGLLRNSLASGLPNPGAATAPGGGASAAGVAVRFDSPVVNRGGPDLVVFEMHKGGGGGDWFHIAPIEANPDWQGITVKRYDIDAAHVACLELPGMDLYGHAAPLRDTQSFLEGGLRPHTQAEGGFQAVATAIDLSEMGVKEGASSSGVVLRSVSGQPAFDPLAVLGLPLPSEENLLTRCAGAAASQAIRAPRSGAGRTARRLRGDHLCPAGAGDGPLVRQFRTLFGRPRGALRAPVHAQLARLLQVRLRRRRATLPLQPADAEADRAVGRSPRRGPRPLRPLRRPEGPSSPIVAEGRRPITFTKSTPTAQTCGSLPMGRTTTSSPSMRPTDRSSSVRAVAGATCRAGRRRLPRCTAAMRTAGRFA